VALVVDRDEQALGSIRSINIRRNLRAKRIHNQI
jgi:hypothetical protein